LIVRHHAGSLEVAVARTRLQNLAISFGIMLVLMLSVALLAISTRRAQSLARQQMEFVSAVSHELRTPLAVIRSAGENLADGVIDDRQQVRRYGALIEREGRRLTDMVEQVLEFAGAQSGRQTYDLRPTAVGEVIASALAACRPQLVEGGFQLELDLPPQVPRVKADAAALGHALQNLLTNAMKYSGESRWIALRARTVMSGEAPELRIIIEDHGLGIAPDDASQIFEPFYRGREVMAAQIHGNGLGLSLVKRIIEAHDGRVSVESTPGRGSSFTLHLPVLASASETPLAPHAETPTRENYEPPNLAHRRRTGTGHDLD
jgi:signal transduction histidine kinase